MIRPMQEPESLSQIVTELETLVMMLMAERDALKAALMQSQEMLRARECQPI